MLNLLRDIFKNFLNMFFGKCFAGEVMSMGSSGGGGGGLGSGTNHVTTEIYSILFLQQDLFFQSSS
jgi:hypothetical protein